MRIEQLLHGYQDGHGLLAGSLQVKSAQDAACLSAMSDWSGYRDPHNQDHSYITAYPLPDSNYYVVAKSWYAYEMERPGCVWTHSLLIDLSELDNRFDFRMLIPYFHRPEKDSYGLYNKSIEIEITETYKGRWEGQKLDEVSMMFILSSLASNAKPFDFKVELNTLWYQQLCLSLLQYMTPAMLTHISLSSGGASLRKYDKNFLSMQFVTDNNSMSLLSPPWKDKLQREEFSGGLSFFANALNDDRHDVPVLIRIFSKDVGDDIGKYFVLGQLLNALYLGASRNKQTGDYTEVIKLLVSAFPQPNEGDLLKQNFLSKKIVALYCEDDELLYELSTIEGTPTAFIGQQINITARLREVINEDRNTYINLIKRLAFVEGLNETGKNIIRDSFDELSCEEISSLDDGVWKNIQGLVSSNQNFLLSTKWLGLDRKLFHDVFFWLRFAGYEKYEHWPELLSRILELNIEVPDYFLDEFFNRVPDAYQQIYKRMNNAEGGAVLANLYERAIRNVTELLKWLEDNQSVSSSMADYIVNDIDPNDRRIYLSNQELWGWLVVNDNGNKSINYYLFEFELAMKWQDKYALPFLTNSFYHIHEALKGSNSDYRIWQRVSKYGGSVGFMDYWDRCKKLRKGIVQHLKQIGVNRSVFMSFTPDVELNVELVKIYDKV